MDHLIKPLKAVLTNATPATPEFRRMLLSDSWAVVADAFALTSPPKLTLGTILKAVAHLTPDQQEMAIRILITGSRVRPPILANPAIGTLRDKLFYATPNRRDVRDWRETPRKVEYLEGFHDAARLAHFMPDAAEIFSTFASNVSGPHVTLAHLSAQQRDWFHAYRYTLSARSRAPKSGRLQTNRLLPAANSFQILVDHATRTSVLGDQA